MSQPKDQDFEKEEENREDVIEVSETICEALPEDKSLVVSEDVFPESLIIVPLYDRPLFPKMLLPVIISIFQAVTQIQEQTLAIIPKMGAMIAVLAFLFPWLLSHATTYMAGIFNNLPRYISF